jgi:hypothetical protein
MMEYLWDSEKRLWICHGLDPRPASGYTIVCGWGATMEEAALHWAARQAKAYGMVVYEQELVHIGRQN